MFKKSETPFEIELLNEAITDAFAEMRGHNSDTEEYANASAQMIKLMQLKDELSSKKRISPETLATIGGNLAGILLILNFEKANVVASKALGFVMKLR